MSADKILFRINVRDVNFFRICFHHTDHEFGRQYYYSLEKGRTTLKDSDELFFGRNVGGKSAAGFAISNIGDKLNGSAPVFNLDFIVCVPFFRKGHYFRLTGVSKDRNKKGTVSIQHFSGYDDLDREYPEIPFLYKELLLIDYDSQLLPIIW